MTDEFLQHDAVIDWRAPSIRKLAAELSAKAEDDESIARTCFDWVRDHIEHSGDHQRDILTCRASDVLKFGTGYCYAKSHLLCALLRANGIPSGLCYQRLLLTEEPATYCLHGLTAVQLKLHGWFRTDPRGNRPDIRTCFNPPEESIAFPVSDRDGQLLPTIHAAPLPVVVRALESTASRTEFEQSLPDWSE